MINVDLQTSVTSERRLAFCGNYLSVDNQLHVDSVICAIMIRYFAPAETETSVASFVRRLFPICLLRIFSTRHFSSSSLLFIQRSRQVQKKSRPGCRPISWESYECEKPVTGTKWRELQHCTLRRVHTSNISTKHVEMNKSDILNVLATSRKKLDVSHVISNPITISEFINMS